MVVFIEQMAGNKYFPVTDSLYILLNVFNIYALFKYDGLFSRLI